MGRNQIPYFSKSCSIPCTTVLSFDNGDTITNPYDIVNIFNNYFTSTAETTKKSIKYSHKHFSDCLSHETSTVIILQPNDKEEIANISSLNSNKASGPYSIPYRILFLLKNEISKQLAGLFYFSFTTGVLPSVLKTAKVVPVFKKDSVKLDYSNYHPISLLSNIEKILEKLMYKSLYNFLNKNNIYITYSLDSDNSILHLMP